MKVGIDLVQISDFAARLKRTDISQSLFTDSELKENQKLESLAGIFAAKEALIKAIGKKVDWLEIEVTKSGDGEPFINSIHLDNRIAIVSITHAGEYASAIVIVN